jgi:hypothetical protein
MAKTPGKELPPKDEVKQNLMSRGTWTRLIFMILFAAIFYVAVVVLVAGVLIQFLLKLFTGDPNARLTKLGESLARYVYQIVRFLTFNTEDMPFPWSDWPGAAPSAKAASGTTPARRRKAASKPDEGAVTSDADDDKKDD